MSKEEEISYIDYEAFLDPDFSATSFANTLVLATNNASDTPLDLSTPLSRVLFDVQEVDTHIDTLTTKSALPLLEHARDDAKASGHILAEVEAQVASLTQSYQALEKEVLERYEVAEQVRVTAERLVQTVRLGRAVARCVMLGRQLEVRMAEVGGVGSAKKEDHRAMVRSADTILSLRHIFARAGSGQEGEGLDRVRVVTTLKNELVVPGERSIASRAQQVVKEFSMSSLLSSAGQTSAASTFAQTEDTKSRTTSALHTLYLLSATDAKTTTTTTTTKTDTFEPTLMLRALQDYLDAGVKSSIAALARALAQLPLLDRTLLEISARCQNIVALQALLQLTQPPSHALLTRGSESESESESQPRSPPSETNLLQPVLQTLDTSSLGSYFWRSVASGMSARMQEIMYKGGVSARTLRSNRERVREAVRECVDRGSRMPGGGGGGGKEQGEGWEREAAVMVGSIVGGIK